MRAHPCPSPSPTPLPPGRRLRGFSSGRRGLARAARRSLFAALAPRWRGTRNSLRRAVRSALNPYLRLVRPAFLARLTRDARFASLIAGAFLSATALPVFASPPIELSDIVAGNGGFAINGIDLSDISGRSVSSAGDVNGDGLADVIVGAPGADGGDFSAGESYVVFGKADGTAVELSAVVAGAGGFVINGVDQTDESGESVSSAGDVNGDGLADLIVGAPDADPGGDFWAGESYVVFGKADGAAVELSAVAAGVGGFVINGLDGNDYSGQSVSSAGDVDGDGLADLIIGAVRADPSGLPNAGESYVVFGKTDGMAVELSAVVGGTGGFVINGIDAEDRAGGVSSAGDVNGDGLADLIVGAARADPAGILNAGECYVIFGKADGTAVELSSVAAGMGGFVINGIDAQDLCGAVSSAGDVNGDGLVDLIVGAPWADAGGNSKSGESYVVFGKADGAAVDLSSLTGGAGGFVLNGIDAGDYSGSSVSSAGDVNGDGLADLIVGAREADPGGRSSAGESYVIFGKADGTAVELSAVVGGEGGFVVNGRSGLSGISVSSAGDIDGDGLSDVIIGAYRATPAGGDSSAGQSYVIFSPEPPAASATYRMKTLAGDGPGGFVAPVTDFGDVARAKIDFSDDDLASGAGLNGASNETVTITRSAASIRTLRHPAGVLWEISSDRSGFASAEITLKYLASEVAFLGDESGFTIFSAPDPAGPWTPLPTARRPERNEVKATVTGFSFFAITGHPNAAIKWMTYE